MSKQSSSIDLLAAGELLIDLMSTEYADTLLETATFRRLQGGSPANLCLNMARLGNRTHLVAAVGADAMGDFLVDSVQRADLPVSGIRRVEEAPTTLILVSRSKEVSDFFPYRGADAQLADSQFPAKLLANTRLFHTTCFALSQEPAQSVLLAAARRAVEAGGGLSIDANYAAKIWPDRAEAQRIVAEYVGMGSLVKISEVDWERLYGTAFEDPNEAADHFLKLGARQVIVTMGGEGCLGAEGESRYFLAARKVPVLDTTGAGDAFWSGYLTAWLDGRAMPDCLLAARNMAEIKLAHLGPLETPVDRQRIYVNLSTR